jgi:hypothetical protein
MLFSIFGNTKRYATRPAFKQHVHIRIQPCNQRKPDWVRSELIRLAALSHGSRRSVARLFNRLHGERYGETVSVSFMCDFLKRHAVQVLRLRRELAAKPPRAVPICHTWAMDLTFFTDEAKRCNALCLLHPTALHKPSLIDYCKKISVMICPRFNGQFKQLF